MADLDMPIPLDLARQLSADDPCRDCDHPSCRLAWMLDGWLHAMEAPE